MNKEESDDSGDEDDSLKEDDQVQMKDPSDHNNSII